MDKPMKPIFRCLLLELCSYLPSLMLIGIDTSPCAVSLYVQLQNDIKKVRTLELFVQNHFFTSFFSFNPNLGYGNQRRLFSGNLPGMFVVVCKTSQMI